MSDEEKDRALGQDFLDFANGLMDDLFRDKARSIREHNRPEIAPTTAPDALAHSCFKITAVDWDAREITVETIITRGMNEIWSVGNS